MEMMRRNSVAPFDFRTSVKYTMNVICKEIEFFIDNLLVRVHFISVMIRWTGIAPWEFEFPFPGSLTSTFLICEHLVRRDSVLDTPASVLSTPGWVLDTRCMFARP